MEDLQASLSESITRAPVLLVSKLGTDGFFDASAATGETVSGATLTIGVQTGFG